MHLSTERKGHQIFFFFPFQHFSCHYFPRFQFPQRWLCLLTLMVFLSPSLDLSFPSLDSGSHHYQCPEPPNVNFKHLISLFSTLPPNFLKAPGACHSWTTNVLSLKFMNANGKKLSLRNTYLEVANFLSEENDNWSL